MLRQSEALLIEKCICAIEQGMDGFAVRDSQKAMMWGVAETLAQCDAPGDGRVAGRHIGLFAVGTGVGKTLGFSIPAIPLARRRGRKLIVSSSTVTLQQQLVGKDLPMLQRLLPVKFSFALAKGRARFACTAKLLDRAARATQQSLGLDAEAESSGATEADHVLVDLAARIANATWDGDCDHLERPVDDALWASITTDRMGCAGSRCHEFPRCGFFKARQLVKDADVVVVNHDLLLAALTMPAGAVLPEPAHCLFVLDEGHNIPAAAVERFAARHTILGATDWLERVAEDVHDIAAALRLDLSLHAAVQAGASAVVRHLSALHAAIEATGAFDERSVRRFRNGVMPHWAQVCGQDIQRDAEQLMQELLGLRELMLDQAQNDAALVQRLLSRLGFYVAKLEALLGTWTLILRDDSRARTPTARWIERVTNGKGEADFMLCASPLSGAEKLTELLWHRAAAVVVTSATLTSCGTFDLFLAQTGLDRFTGCRLLQLPSPFDYAKQGELVVPRMRSDPRNTVAHTNEIVEMLPRLIRTRGTLVIFSSMNQLREVVLRLPAELRAIVKSQSVMPKLQIIAQHRAAIDRGERSVIVGTRSFREGLDLVREYLTHVIIVRLAFQVPDSPLEEARRDWIEAQGRSAFLEVSVPEAAVRLEQSVGRLIRTQADHGTVTILDRRIATSRWGRLLLKGLPPFRLRIFPADDSAEAEILKPAQRAVP